MTTKRGHCKTCGKPCGYFVYCKAHRQKNNARRSARRGRWTMRISGGTYEPPTPADEPKPLVEAVGPVFVIPAPVGD